MAITKRISVDMENFIQYKIGSFANPKDRNVIRKHMTNCFNRRDTNGRKQELESI